MNETTDPAPTASPVSPGRVVLGGFLMGLANLVPGVSGGTMILAIGLYDRFIDTIARVTRFKLNAATIAFMVQLVGGAGAAIVLLAPIAVWLVIDHRWFAYSLFVGMTLGGAPLLWRSIQPIGVKELVAFLPSFAVMVWVALFLSNSPLEPNALNLALVGALAASSMILPGISGSYILLIFGMYDLVIGSLRPGDLLDDPTGALGVLVPVGIGVVLGIALLSNVLKGLLERFHRPAHAALLGLLLGSVVGLWPFQEPVHAELATKKRIEAVLLAIEDAPVATIEEETGVALTDAERSELRATYEGRTKGELKLMGLAMERYSPPLLRVVISLATLVGGFVLTLRLGKKE